MPALAPCLQSEVTVLPHGQLWGFHIHEPCSLVLTDSEHVVSDHPVGSTGQGAPSQGAPGQQW